MTRLLLLAILFIVIARIFWRVFDGIIDGARATPRANTRPPAQPVKLVRDPVCGTFVAPGKSFAFRAGGETHYFCSVDCRERFRKSA